MVSERQYFCQSAVSLSICRVSINLQYCYQSAVFLSNLKSHFLLPVFDLMDGGSEPIGCLTVTVEILEAMLSLYR